MALLLHGDCLNQMKGLKDKSVDCFVCDLPYGCLTGGGGKEKTMRKEKGSGDSIAGCSWDIKIDLVEFWKQVKRLSRNDHTPVLMFCTTKFGAELINSNPDWFRHDLVWDKGCGVSFLSANKMPMRSHEMIYVFSKKGAYYKRKDIEGDFPQWSVGKNGVRTGNHADAGLPKQNIHGGNGKRCALSVIPMKSARSNQKGKKKEHKHPTEKPAELYKWLLERYCPPDGTMLDPTAGSFNSVFTAQEMGLHAIGIEKDDAFFWKAVGKVATPPKILSRPNNK